MVRGKCPYCSFSEDQGAKELLETKYQANYGGDPGTDIYLNDEENGATLNVEAEVDNPARDTIYESVQINYCPRCGRELASKNDRKARN